MEAASYSKKELKTRSGDIISRIKFKPEIFMDRTIVLYGSSGSGKSVCIKNIMFSLKDIIERVIVVSPTEPANKTYESIVPTPMIHTELYMPDPDSKKKSSANEEIQGATRFLERIYNLQKMMSDIYHKAQNQQVIEQLFNRIPAPVRDQALHMAEDYRRKRDRTLAKLRSQYAHEENKCKELCKLINEKCKKATLDLYKKYIHRNLSSIMKMKLTDDEKYTVEYLYFNPHLLLILDDCASHFKSLVRNNIVRALFYQGRHVKITTIIACQDDTDLPPNLKKNVFISIFTDPIVTSAFFNRASNSISKPQKELVNKNIEDIFVKHRKFMYIREDPEKQHFYIIDEPMVSKFRFGSEALYDLCYTIQSEENNLDDKNPFYSRFRI